MKQESDAEKNGGKKTNGTGNSYGFNNFPYVSARLPRVCLCNDAATLFN